MAGTAKQGRTHFQVHTSTGASLSPATRPRSLLPMPRSGQFPDRKNSLVKLTVTQVPCPGFSSALSLPWDLGGRLGRGSFRDSVDSEPGWLREPVLAFFLCPTMALPYRNVPPGCTQWYRLWTRSSHRPGFEPCLYFQPPV